MLNNFAIGKQFLKENIFCPTILDHYFSLIDATLILRSILCIIIDFKFYEDFFWIYKKLSWAIWLFQFKMLERSIVSDRLGNEWSRYMPRKKKDRFIRISDKHRASYSTICGLWFLTTPVIKRAATSALQRILYYVQTLQPIKHFLESFPRKIDYRKRYPRSRVHSSKFV